MTLASQGQSAAQAKTAWQATRSRGAGPRDLVDGAAPLNGPNPHARKKAPETVRRALLDGAAAIAASRGLAAMSVQTVADSAKVTKGGLFHHFPNKQALVEGLLADQFEKLDAVLDDIIAADPLPYGRFTRAYVTLIFDHPRAGSWATMAGMMIADPAIRARWATWIAERLTRHADTDSGIEFELTRLAADGAWHRHLVDGGLGPQLSAIRRRLIEATQPAGTRS
ncbi:TetR/AcrR family transcriptional regulator [Sphingopyxis chilensis]|uniref:TetR/AcrR family transcriptional regulator n=1 Tax=Sphingopyxis chilensis TaxID=180400 RepID=UPI002DDD882A|nr:TetR/AcrR family transcriptional regulator [Sphingopyxis chilensis]